MRFFQKKIFLFSGFLFLLLWTDAPCGAAQWNIFETGYLKIYYLSLDDLKIFDKKIDYGDVSSGFLGFGGGQKKGDEFVRGLTTKMDKLYRKIQRLLDMKKKTSKVKVKIYSNKKLLLDSYYNIYGKRANLRAWYIFEYNTIYLNVKDLNAGMLAHELGHAISDNYFGARPPRATAEIIARYVDAHLYDENVREY